MSAPSDADAHWLREAFAVATLARSNGNHPFGAVFVSAEGRLLLRAENSVNTDSDFLGHAEANLVRDAVRELTERDVKAGTLYASTEPCMMCAGAIAWAGIGTVVFGLSQHSLQSLAPSGSPRFRVPTQLRDLLSGVQPPIRVRGPLLEDEASVVHVGFWKPG